MALQDFGFHRSFVMGFPDAFPHLLFGDGFVVFGTDFGRLFAAFRDGICGIAAHAAAFFPFAGGFRRSSSLT